VLAGLRDLQSWTSEVLSLRAIVSIQQGATCQEPCCRKQGFFSSFSSPPPTRLLLSPLPPPPLSLASQFFKYLLPRSAAACLCPLH
jgi:hypothetical protein